MIKNGDIDMSFLMSSFGMVLSKSVPVLIAKNVLITTSQAFVAEKSGIHRILLIGGGGGGGYDNGGGGGSGYATYGTLELVAGNSYSASVGTGGQSAGQNDTIGLNGTASAFAGQLTAGGGMAGWSHSVNLGGNGGSGGGGGYQYPGGDGGTGGGDGTASATPFAGGTGQGASFTTGFSTFVRVSAAPGAGGLGSRTSPNGPGGGGGGIVIDGDISITGGLDVAGMSKPGIGYGAGAAGGSGPSRPLPSGPGADGMVLIEWDTM